jgi:hypothetical protein
MDTLLDFPGAGDNSNAHNPCQQVRDSPAEGSGINPTKEQELLNALRRAEELADLDLLEGAVNRLSLYYVGTNQFLTAAPYWRRGAELVEKLTAPYSLELATYLRTMATLCLLPAGLLDEARATLQKSKKLYAVHYGADAQPVRDMDQQLKGLGERIP